VRTSTRFLLGAGAFSLVVAISYWFLAYEDAGFALLLFMGLAAAFLGGWFLWHVARVRRPEDDPEADHAQSAGEEVGRFSGGSLWPLVMGVALILGVEGFVYGAWLLGFGGVLFVLAAVGMMLESRD
jgi:hypothetical protein